MFSRRQKSAKAGALALCVSCFSLSVSSAPAASRPAPPDGVLEGPSATSTPRASNLTEGETALGRNPQNEDLLRQNAAGSAQLLDNEELAQLAERAEEPGDDVVGGALNNQQLTYIVIALAAAVFVLIAK